MQFLPIQKGIECSATIGINRGRPLHLTLDPTVCDTQVIYHEFMHVMGMLHEHQRPDRDNHVTVHLHNVPWGLDKNFRKYTRSLTLGLPYDGLSILHYETGQGSPDSNPTITSNVSTCLPTCFQKKIFYLSFHYVFFSENLILSCLLYFRTNLYGQMICLDPH